MTHSLPPTTAPTTAGLAAIVTVVACLLVLALRAVAADVALTVRTDKVVGQVDEKVYGQFLEHIYHSVNGGLWGEMVWDRTFEGGQASSRWVLADGCLVHEGHAPNTRLMIGDPKWTDYEFTLEARKIDGSEGFLVLFRETSKDDFYWANLGGWQNKRHGLERGTKGEGRWRGVGKTQEGSIEKGKWYRIRVRCEGAKIQVFLDDAKVLDLTDEQGAHLAGRVGVGTWETSAAFRSFKVTSLDGKLLFEGLPKNVPPASDEGTWTTFGQGQFERTKDSPLNGEFCQLVAPSGSDEAGIRQRPFCIRAGETYYGSLWARGQAGGLAVRLLDGEKVLAEAKLDAPKDAWQERTFTLQPAGAADNATLQVAVCGGGKVWLDQVSLMPGAARATGGFRPDLLKAVADLRPPIIRWPGGCYASMYRWKDGVGPQHKRVKYPKSMWDDLDVNSFGTDEFLALCRKVAAQPLIVVDIGMHDKPNKRGEYMREAAEWVEYCNAPATTKWGAARAANGHPEPYGVKYWEIDNEVWTLKPEQYTPIVRDFVAAMKKMDPSIIVGACGSGQLGEMWGDGDARVLADCAGIIDYLSVHHYEGAEHFADGPAKEEAFLRGRGKMIAGSANPKVKLYVSEWNAQSTDWRTGLYAGGILNAFERCGDIVGLAGPALFLRHVSAKGWDNAFINFDHRTWFPAPNYVVMKLWRDHYSPDRLELTGDAAGLNVMATRSADGKYVYLKAVNPTDQPATLRLEVQGGFVPVAAELKVVAGESLTARNTLETPNAIRPIDAKVALEGTTATFDLPRWSVGVLTVRGK